MVFWIPSRIKYGIRWNDNLGMFFYFRSNPSCQFAIDATEHENLTCSGGFAEGLRPAPAGAEGRHAVPWATAGRPYKFYFRRNESLIGSFLF